MALRERCKELLSNIQRNAMLRVGSGVDDLYAFVLAERGKSADERLEDAAPLVLYFGTREDRDKMLEIIREAKPGMMTKSLP